ncbi:hypothetical protein SARC_01658 [Sphaeroforma arctica JP610]|uniref:BUB1 N-terminal domain-containing protein n=1 Tax=Sphaeroforma arctica JP610 TaxID=667725 RepID=A0A0L0GB05_9EUKA|nr:hypothetical protein SARC_01658 [Sphaeroforma arctica JP610]KNC86180.1 hypothetical protein SARC_01658 [Sphaeroforma arctica JP610]|eukprot:XP_014160082.1 hypothetical protein SARC_01658 [Sphaeroforma arctica JP610]
MESRQADGATDPVDIFKFLKSREIGVTLALLYEAYSLALETKGSKKQASLVYEEGIQNNAQPLERLKRRHREYQMRLTEDLKANMEAMSFGALADSNDGRKTLGRLARTRNGLLPVHHSRDGHQQQSTRPSTKRRASNTGGVSVFVDDDEENQPPSQETAAKVWSHVPSGASVRKENTLTAGRWTGGGRSEDAPVSVGYHPLEFPVFHDESNEDSADRHSLPARMLDHTGPSLQESRKRGEELMQNPLQNFRKPAKNFDGSGAWDQLDRLPLVDANGGEVSIEEVRAQSSAYKYTDSGANPSANIKGGEPNVDMEIDTDVTSQKRPQDDTHTQPIPRKILDFTTPALNQLKTPLCVSNSINAGRGILFSSSVSDRHVDSSADLAHSRPTNRDAITSQKRLKIDADSQRPSMSAASSSGQPVPKPRPTVKGVSSLQTPPNADTDKSNPSISVPASKENVPSTSVDASPSSTTVHATSETVPTSTANVLVKQSGEPVSKSGSPASEPDIPSLTVGTVPAIPNEPSTTARQDHTASNTEATSNASPLLSTSESSAAVTDSRPVKEVGGIHSAQSASSIFVDEPSMSDVNEVDTKSVSTRESGPNALGFDMFMDDTEKLDDVVAGAAHSVEADARSSPTPALAPSGINTSSNAHGKISDDLYKKEAAPLVVVTSLTNGNSLPGGDHQETQRDESVHTASASHPLTGTSNENASAGDEELKGEQGVVIKREVNAANVYEATREGGGDSPHVGSVDAGGVGDFRVPFESGHVDGDQEHRENARPNLDSYRIGDSDEETNDVANKEKHPPISPTITTKLATADLFDIFRSRPLPGDEDGDTLHSMPFLGGADRPVSASGVSPTHNRDFNHPMFGADKTASCSTSTAEPFQIFQDPTMTGTILPLPPPAKTAYDSQESEELSNAVLAESKSIFQDPENNENDPNVFDGARKNPTDRVSHLVMRTEGERKPITPLEVVPDEVQDIDEDQKGQGDMLGQSEGRVTNADVLREGGMMPLDSSFSRSPGIKSTSGDVLADG